MIGARSLAGDDGFVVSLTSGPERLCERFHQRLSILRVNFQSLEVAIRRGGFFGPLFGYTGDIIISRDYILAKSTPVYI